MIHFFQEILLETNRGNHIKQKIRITNIFFSIFSSKTVSFGSVFRAEMNSACKNTPIRVYFIGFTENRLFSENFRTGYSMAIFMLTVKKLIYTNLAIFGFFLSNKHDSFGFRKFCLKLIEKNHKKQKIMIANIFFYFLHISQKLQALAPFSVQK